MNGTISAPVEDRPVHEVTYRKDVVTYPIPSEQMHAAMAAFGYRWVSMNLKTADDVLEDLEETQRLLEALQDRLRESDAHGIVLLEFVSEAGDAIECALAEFPRHAKEGS